MASHDDEGVQKDDKMTEAWQKYEDVAQKVLKDIAENFDIGHVEGKQIISGASGTEWEIDLKGVLNENDGIIVVECKRYTKAGVNQSQLASLAYTIKDSGACGGILVTSMDPQTGAKKIAIHENIHIVKMDKDSTATDYIVDFLNKIKIRRTEHISLRDDLSITMTDKEGNVIDSGEFGL